jgi:hypothetical protein
VWDRRVHRPHGPRLAHDSKVADVMVRQGLNSAWASDSSWMQMSTRKLADANRTCADVCGLQLPDSRPSPDKYPDQSVPAELCSYDVGTAPRCVASDKREHKEDRCREPTFYADVKR